MQHDDRRASRQLCEDFEEHMGATGNGPSMIFSIFSMENNWSEKFIYGLENPLYLIQSKANEYLKETKFALKK